MSDGINFDPLGTITVTIDSDEYRLTRPKMGQWRYFQRRIRDMSTEVTAELAGLTQAAQKATDKAAAKPTPKNTAEAEIAQAQLAEYAQTPFYEHTLVWVREVFDQLGDKPLPEDVDDWPTWLAADVSLPMEIINHWKTTPPHSGSAK